MNEIFTSINGYLLRVFLSDQQSINLEQFKYNSTIKRFDLLNQNSIKLDSLIQIKSNFKYTLIKDKNHWFLIWLKINNDNFKAILIVSNQTNSYCNFDLNISNSINSSINSLNLKTDLDFLDNIYFKFDNFNFKNYIIYLVIKENQKYNLKYYQNLKWNTIRLFESIKSLQVLNWYDLSKDNDNDGIDLSFYSSKLFISFHLISQQNQIDYNYFKSYLIDINSSNQICLSVNNDELYGYFTKFTSLDNNELDKSKLNDLNENFFSKINFLTENSTKQNESLKLLYFKLIDIDLKCQNDLNIIANGRLVLVFVSESSKSTYFLYLNNGSIKYRKKFENNISFNKFTLINNQFECDNNIGNYFIMSDSNNINHYFYFDEESIEIIKKFNTDHEQNIILNDYFEIDEDSSFINYLLIKDWQSDNYKLVPSLSKLSPSQINNDNNNEDESFGLDLSRDLNDLMSIDDNNESMNCSNDNEFIKKPKTTTVKPAKQNCANDLFKILKYKEHMSDLLFREAIIECKRKYSLIAELTKYSTSNLQTSNNLLPKMIELYSSEIVSKKENNFKDQLNILNKPLFEFKKSFTCYLDGFFMINLIFSTNFK